MDTSECTERRSRVREWLTRYGPAELAGIVGALLATLLVAAFVSGRPGGPAAVAFAGSIGEGIAFYGVLLARDLRAAGSVLRTVRNLLVEFGPAELLDALFVRPAAMFVGPLLVGDVVGGVILGKVAADAVFYSVAIVGYELRRYATAGRATN